MKLRSYQERAVAQLRQVWRQSAVLVMPTGAGKTVVAAAVIQGALAKNRRTLIVSHTRAIVLQTVARFRDAGLDTGCIMGEETANVEAPVLVASIQTLAARNLRPDIDVLIIDEVHRATSKTYADLIAHYTGASAVIGLTATPCRLDGRGLSDVGFTTLVEPVSYEELFACGALVQPKMYAPPDVPDMRKARVLGGEFAGQALDDAGRFITGHVVEHYQRFAPGSRAVAFGVSIEHAQEMARAFTLAGVPAVALSGEDSQDTRDTAVDGLRRGSIRVLTNCSLFGEGWDLPVLETVILARPTASLALHRQQCGRVMRPAPNKQAATIIDAAGNLDRHGAPWEPIDWSLTSKVEVKPRVQALRRCGACFALFAGSACPECKWAPPPPAEERSPVEVVPGELVEWKVKDRETWYRAEVTKASARGWKLGAARNHYRDKFGAWPKFYDLERAVYVCPRQPWEIDEADERVSPFNPLARYRCQHCCRDYPSAMIARQAHESRV